MNIHSLTIDDILRGTESGRAQSVGHMQVVPLLGEDVGGFAPPRVEISTTSYGTVVLRNRDARPTIIPPAPAGSSSRRRKITRSAAGSRPYAAATCRPSWFWPKA